MTSEWCGQGSLLKTYSTADKGGQRVRVVLINTAGHTHRCLCHDLCPVRKLARWGRTKGDADQVLLWGLASPGPKT